SNQAHLLAQTSAAQLQLRDINAIAYHPQMQVVSVKYEIPAASDILVRLQVLDQPLEPTDPDAPSAPPSIDEIAWQVTLSYPPASDPSQALAQTLHQRILTEVGLGDRGCYPMIDLWPDVEATPDQDEPPTPNLAVLVSLSPIQIPADDYPPIPLNSLVRVLVSEMGDRLMA
ncbi:MAG: hypothetical protein VKJ64_00830, partial [Leptolyngbyaceae bacterium]|nr:hypothetical protein [Leptolyngbyaceae bacterium]